MVVEHLLLGRHRHGEQTADELDRVRVSIRDDSVRIAFFCTAFINLCVKRENRALEEEASSSQTGLSEKLMETEQQTQKLPLKDLVFYVVVANMSIIGLNVSLMLNTIGFYQVCKLAQIPTMCILEASFLNKKFSGRLCKRSSSFWQEWPSRRSLRCGDEYCRDDCSERRGVEHIRAANIGWALTKETQRDE